MKIKILLLLLAFGCLFSCSTDNSDDSGTDDEVSMEDDGMMDDDGMADDEMNDDVDGDIELEGLWVLSEIRLDEGVDDIELELLDLVVDDLFEQECYLISFDFKDDGTLDAESRVADFEIEGTEVQCPENIETTTGEWLLDGDQLTVTDDLNESETITIIVEDENTFVIAGEEGIDEEFVGSQAVFIRIP